jgi:hypothetical protein
LNATSHETPRVVDLDRRERPIDRSLVYQRPSPPKIHARRSSAASEPLEPPAATLPEPLVVLSKDEERDRRDVLARIVKKLKRVHDLTRAEVRATFYPKSIESLRLLAKDYDIEQPLPPAAGISSKDKQKAYRLRVREKLADQERRDLIARIVLTIRHQQHFSQPSPGVTVNIRSIINRSNYREALMSMRLEDLREIAKVYRTVDMTGRKKFEGRTGGNDGPKLTVIEGARWRDLHQPKKKKMGHAIDCAKDDPAKQNASASGWDSKSFNRDEKERTFDEKMRFVAEMLFTLSNDLLVCPFCRFECGSLEAAGEHFGEKYRAFLKQHILVKAVRQAFVEGLVDKKFVRDSEDQLERMKHHIQPMKRWMRQECKRSVHAEMYEKLKLTPQADLRCQLCSRSVYQHPRQEIERLEKIARGEFALNALPQPNILLPRPLKREQAEAIESARQRLEELERNAENLATESADKPELSLAFGQ